MARKMGRRPIPIEEYIDKLEHALGLGATYELAALYAGISVSTFQRWRHQATQAREGTPLARLRDQLLAAEGQAVVNWLQQIETVAKEGNWQAAAWKLERRYPDAYGRRAQVDLTVQVRQAMQAVADEIGIDVHLLMQEAQDYLAETKRASTA